MENNSQFIADLLYLLQVTGLSDLPTILVYLIPVIIAVFIYIKAKNKKESVAKKALEKSKTEGYFEPTSLQRKSSTR